MNIRIVTIAALALLAAGCAPDAPDSERSANQAGQDAAGESRQLAQRDTGAPDATARDSEIAADGSTAPSPGADVDPAHGEMVGKMVVGTEGQLLGNTQRIVRNKESKETLAVVAVSNAVGMERKEVVVPVNELQQEDVPDKLKLQMNMEQLASQPSADSDKFVDVKRWVREPDTEGQSSGSQQPSTIAQDATTEQ